MQNNERISPTYDQWQYEKNKREIAMVMGRHMVRHMLLLYKEFEGDLLLPIILGEIAHHNVKKLYTLEGSCPKARSDIPSGAERLKFLEPTNAFSISEATGIPRETVRRKIFKLIDKGWVVKGSRGEVVITENVSEYFTRSFNKELLTEFLTASECITGLLHGDEH